jgi:hypothetical protein
MSSRRATFARKLRRLIAYRYSVTPVERVLMHRFGRNKPAVALVGAPRVLVACVEELFLFCMFGEVVAALRDRGDLIVDQFVIRGLRVDTSRSIRRFLAMGMEINGLSDRKWARIYSGFCDRVAIRAAGFISPVQSLIYLVKAWRMARAIRDVDQLAGVTMSGIVVGDLLIDSYLRYKPSPKVDVRDRYLIMVIRQALKNVDMCRTYFARYRPALFLANYATYIQHGIAVRAALQAGVPVQAFASTYQQFSIHITAEHAIHNKPVDGYRRDFLALPEQAEKLKLAYDGLAGRLAGEVDPAIAYMKSSAYAIKTTDVPDVEGAAVIFLHDFYDSPHSFRWMLFHDFYDWTRFTLETLTAAGLPFFIKPHPNQILASALEIPRLQAEFPNARFISADVSNQQLVQAGMKCGITIYGSIASELAFLGVPTIGAGDNPHVAFSFCKLAQSREEYRRMLLDFQRLNDDPATLREEACMFHYMHNLNLDEDERKFRDAYIEVWSGILEMQATQIQSQEKILADLDMLTNKPAFQRFADCLHARLRASADNRK